MSFKAWRLKVSIAQSDPTVSPLPPSPTEGKCLHSEAHELEGLDEGPLSSPNLKGSLVSPKLEVEVMDSGPKSHGKSKPSLGVRVLRTLFDNSPPTYAPPKPSNAAAAQAKQQKRSQELQKEQETQKALKGVKSGRPPHPAVVIEKSPTHSEEIDETPSNRSLSHGGPRRPTPKSAHTSSASSPKYFADLKSGAESLDDARSSSYIGSDSELDFSSSEREYRMNRRTKMPNRSPAAGPHRFYDDIGVGVGLGLGLRPGESASGRSDLESGEKVETLKQEIERLRLENRVLRRRGMSPPLGHHHLRNESDVSRASSLTEVNSTEGGQADGWIPVADYAPPGVTSASVARFYAQAPLGHRTTRGEVGERQFSGEHVGRRFGHGSSSETTSVVTDGSRASSRHHSGVLQGEPEPLSGVTSLHARSDLDDCSVMSWDGPPSRFSSDRRQYESAHHSRASSRAESAMLVDGEEEPRGAVASNTNRGEPQVDDGPDGPRRSFMSPRMSLDLWTQGTDTEDDTIQTVEETYTHRRLVTKERRSVDKPSYPPPLHVDERDDDPSRRSQGPVAGPRRPTTVGRHDSDADSKGTVSNSTSRTPSHELDPLKFSYAVPAIIKVPRSKSTHQSETDHLSQFLQQQRLSAEQNYVPRSASTSSQNSMEDYNAGSSSSASSQHQSTWERLMISQKRRQSIASLGPSQEQTINKSRQGHSKSPLRR